MLCDAGYTTSIETSGAVDIRQVDKRVSTVMDIKTPGSGELERNRYENLERSSTAVMVTGFYRYVVLLSVESF